MQTVWPSLAVCQWCHRGQGQQTATGWVGLLAAGLSLAARLGQTRDREYGAAVIVHGSPPFNCRLLIMTRYNNLFSWLFICQLPRTLSSARKFTLTMMLTWLDLDYNQSDASLQSQKNDFQNQVIDNYLRLIFLVKRNDLDRQST